MEVVALDGTYCFTMILLERINVSIYFILPYVLPVSRYRDNIFPAVKIYPAMSRTVIFAVDFVINVFRTVTAWIVLLYRQYRPTHAFTYTHNLCADQPLKRKRHFFRCAANKKIWHLEAIRRAVILDVDFVINGGQDGHCVKHIGSIHTETHSHTRIFVRRSAINVTFCE